MQRAMVAGARICGAVSGSVLASGPGGMQAMRLAPSPWMMLGMRTPKSSSRKIEVVLIQNFKNLGDMGESHLVRPGYARNFLIPQKMAVYATFENRAKFMLPPNKEELVRKEEAKRVELVTKKMSKIKLTFKRHSTDGATLYGSVTARNIVQALAKQGMELDESKVDLPQPIKALGQFTVPVTIPSGDVVQMDVEIIKR